MSNVIISVQELQDLQKSGDAKVLEAIFTPAPKPNPDDFPVGKFDELTREKTTDAFKEEHIPGAVPFVLDVACKPGKFTRFDFYNKEEFADYLCFLGVKENQKIVFYARGPNGGFAMAGRAHFILKLYGVDSQILNGGFAAWKAAGASTETGLNLPEKSSKKLDLSFNEKSSWIILDKMIEVDAKGKNLFDNLSQINYMDCRPLEQYTTGVGAILGTDSTGYRCKGARHFSSGSVFNSEGLFDREKAVEYVKSLNLVPSVQPICACNTGMQACVAYVTFEELGYEPKLFNGSMTELAARASHLINDK